MTYITVIIPQTELVVSQSLKKMKGLADITPPARMPLTAQTLAKLDTFITNYNDKFPERNYTAAKRVEIIVEKNEYHTNLLRYVSDFINELNTLIRRNSTLIDNGFTKFDRIYYNLTLDSDKLPNLNSEAKLLYWANQMINGEESRIADGGTPISSPTLKQLKKLYNGMVLRLSKAGELKNKAKKSQKELTAIIKFGIKVYIDARYDLEYFYRNMSDTEKRSTLELWGIIYITVENTEKKET